MEHTIESRVAAAILEKSIGSIEIDGMVYQIAPPSTATLILVSEIVSTLPVVEKVPKELAVYSALHYAKDFRGIGDIAAVLILGAKNLTEEREVSRKKILGIIPRKSRRVTVDVRKELADKLLNNVRPSVLYDCVLRRLQDMEIASFFVITTSLSEANILRPTREVVR